MEFGIALLSPSFLDDSVQRNGKVQYVPAWLNEDQIVGESMKKEKSPGHF